MRRSFTTRNAKPDTIVLSPCSLPLTHELSPTTGQHGGCYGPQLVTRSSVWVSDTPLPKLLPWHWWYIYLLTYCTSMFELFPFTSEPRKMHSTSVEDRPTYGMQKPGLVSVHSCINDVYLTACNQRITFHISSQYVMRRKTQSRWHWDMPPFQLTENCTCK